MLGLRLGLGLREEAFIPHRVLTRQRLYELLALIDMLRGGRARERQWAERRIEKILKTASAGDAL